MSIHQEVSLKGSPDQVYTLLLDSERFTAATGRPATIGASEGDAFSVFGGFVEGRQIALQPGREIVQAWRGNGWPEGEYSLVRFTLSAEGEGTRLTLRHDAYPSGPSPMYASWHEHLATNWPVFYFEPMKKYLADQAFSTTIG